MAILLLVALVGLGVLSILAWRRKSARARQLAELARVNGFFYSAEDHWSSTRVPFNVFRLGDNFHIENVLLGKAPDGADVRVFDLTSWKERETEDGVQRSSYRSLTCCLTETDGSLPHLVLQPETLATRFLGKVGMPDLDFESEEFNRRFVVHSEDEQFARLCVDPVMMDFLLGTQGKFQFEVRGRWAVVAGPQVPPKLCLSLVRLAMSFRQSIPAVVWQHYPPLVREDF